MNATGFTKSQPLPLFTFLGLGLVVLYVSVYLVLSLCGHYRPMAQGGLSHWEEYSVWEPAGFRLDSSDGKGITSWRPGVMKAFYPLWIADVRWLHRRQDVYMRARRDVTGEWTYQTNSWLRAADGEWILTNIGPSTAATK